MRTHAQRFDLRPIVLVLAVAAEAMTFLEHLD